MKHFYEFISEKDGVMANPSTIQFDQTELLQRIIQHHGARFRLLLKKLLTRGEVDDDPDLLADLKELYGAIKSTSHDQYPIKDRSRTGKEPDVVTRPKADGGSGPGGAGGGVGGGEGGE